MVEPLPLRPSRRDHAREERLGVPRLLEAGTITVDAATTLLDALDRAAAPPPNGGAASARSAWASQVRIRVSDSTTGRGTVNLAFPLGPMETELGIPGRFVPEDLPEAEAIRESVADGFHGPLVDLDDGGQRVEIVAG